MVWLISLNNKAKCYPVMRGCLPVCRALLGLSQENLGETVGGTFQKIQKQERGVNRIGASRLY